MKRLALSFLLVLGISCAHATPANARPRDPMQRALDNTVALTEGGRIFCSGFISEGLVITAAHCVEGEALIVVERRDGATSQMAVVAIDTTLDVAALRPLAGELGKGIPLARKAPSYGDEVFVLGHSGGDDYPYSLTRGIVSNPRRVETEGSWSGMVWMQHDAGSIGGNSGGPVMDSRGRIVGVTSFGALSRVLCGFPNCPPLYAGNHISGAAHLESVEGLLASL